MSYVAVDEDGEWKFSSKPSRGKEVWIFNIICRLEKLPKGSIEKLIGKKLTWEDEPVELKEK